MPIFTPEIFTAEFANGTFTETYPAGCLVTPAPRRAARGRSSEVLFAALDLRAQTPLPAEELSRLTSLLSHVYFATPGSVTAALRAAFVAINAEVLPFGQLPTSIAPAGGGLVQLHAVCAVIQEGGLYLGYAGDVLALILRDNSVESYPARGDTPPRPLAASMNVDLRYGHSTLSSPTTLILAASPAPSWIGAPAGLGNLSLPAIAERMAQQSASRPGLYGGLLIRFSREETAPSKTKFLFPGLSLRSQPGKGKTSVRPAQEAAASVATVKPVKHKDISPVPIRSKDSVSSAGTGPLVNYSRDSVGKPAPSSTPESPPSPSEKPVTMVQPPFKEPVVPAAQARSPISRNRIPFSKPQVPTEKSAAPGLTAREAASSFFRSIRVTLSSAIEGMRSFLAGILPRGVLQENDRFSLPPSVLLGTAIAIPLIAVAVAGVIMFRRGYAMEFDRLMQEARVQVAVAEAQTDPIQARQAWQEAFDLLKTASRYGSSAELTALQTHAAGKLDDFDGIVPLDFKPAITGGLESDSQINAILVGDQELFILDSTYGRILHLLPGKGGYQVDEKFVCQAGAYPGITVGPLLDIAWVPDLTVGTQLPSSSRSGTVIALDTQGVLLYCPLGGSVMADELKAPTPGWSTPVAAEFYNTTLYVLDSGNNGLWKYELSDRTGFDRPPTDYFRSQGPSIADVVDFAIGLGDVYFLHADGHVTRCRYDQLLQTEGGTSEGGALCVDLVFHDAQSGRYSGSRIEGALFTRIFSSEMPEPTLLFLDSLGRGAYSFSMALTFISRYRVTIAPTQHEATALAIGLDKVLYIAIGNQIYYAQTRIP